MTPDDIITAITEAATETDALAVLAGVPRGLLLAVADLVYTDPDGHGVPWIRRAILAEARAGVGEETGKRRSESTSNQGNDDHVAN